MCVFDESVDFYAADFPSSAFQPVASEGFEPDFRLSVVLGLGFAMGARLFAPADLPSEAF